MSLAGAHRLAPDYVQPEKPPPVYGWRSWAWDALCWGYPWLRPTPRVNQDAYTVRLGVTKIVPGGPLDPSAIRMPTGTVVKPPPTRVPGEEAIERKLVRYDG